MRQFDVLRNPDPASARSRPYLVVLQSDLLQVMETVVVAPLARSRGVAPVKRLTPTVEVAGRGYLIMTHELAAVARSELKTPITNVAVLREQITSAIDLIFFGF
jgi:toxin CcdB